MKRSQPLRRTPLPQRTTPLRRSAALQTSAPLQRRTKVRAVSAKRAAVQQERREFVQRILRERPLCQACHAVWSVNPDREGWTLVRSAYASDVHELVRRSQGSPIVPSQGLRDSDVLALCRRCHTWIGEHPAEAVRLGLARWGYRRSPAQPETPPNHPRQEPG